MGPGRGAAIFMHGAHEQRAWAARTKMSSIHIAVEEISLLNAPQQGHPKE
jgi:hypothetical protein